LVSLRRSIVLVSGLDINDLSDADQRNQNTRACLFGIAPDVRLERICAISCVLLAKSQILAIRKKVYDYSAMALS